MKHLIFVVIDNHIIAEDIIHCLMEHGYNGSVIPSNSFKHSLENDGEVPIFFNLSHVENKKLENSTTLNIVVEENQVNDVTELVRNKTEKFTKCHGGMFVLPIESFEGSF